MEKLKLHTPDFTEANIAKLAELFPSCVVEAKDEETGELRRSIDFDQLRQELSGQIVEGPQERYRLDWPGKREALLAANAPIAKTLRPVREESVDFDTTENLFIEGDNLDALKLLQETYLGKVKMIYIDPPYNTGNDFIYDDDFAEDAETYFARSNQKDESGKLVANPDSNGRFHSDWLTMMYSRLRLARNLLKSDGTIFISIDDGEVANLRKVADEIFGEDNFVANVIWEKKFSAQNDSKWFSDNHDHILVYALAKDIWRPNQLPRTSLQDDRYKNPDNDPRGPWASDNLTVRSYSASYDYEIVTPSGRKVSPAQGRCWGVPKDKFIELVKEDRIWFGEKGENVPRLKRFLSDVKDGLTPLTIWKRSDVGDNQDSRRVIRELFGSVGIFDTPKPVNLLKRMLQIGTRSEDIILDFFAGSSTTAHAVMQLNAEDGGNRPFIMVQLPEACNEKSEAFKAGYKNIAEISKERIRRAGKKIKEEHATTAATLDTGFRVLKVDTSNVKEIYYTPDQIKQDELALQVDHIKEGRSPEDLLFQVMLDWGIDLALPITPEKIQGRQVYFVDENAIAACFETGIDEDFVKELAKRQPLRAVFRDSSYADDAVKINIGEIFKLLSPATEIKTL